MVTWYFSPAKRLFDLGVASLLFIVFLPLLVGLALLIKLTSHGPVIFSQKRLGKDGQAFTLYKFRTMAPDAEKLQNKLSHLNEADGPVFKVRHDPRFTRFGKWLAHSGLDELPQLFNVLKGDMSLVGPRPLPIQEARNIPAKWRKLRERVRPGIVSSWVIRGSQQDHFSRWMEGDIQDEDNSFGQDLRILWLSCFIILGKFRDLGKRFLRSLPHAHQILASFTRRFIQHILTNPTSYSLLLLYIITFSLFFLNGGEALSGQILFLVTPLLVLPLLFTQKLSLTHEAKLIIFLWFLYLASNVASTALSASLSLSVPALIKLLGIFVFWLLFSVLFTQHRSQHTILTNIIIGVGFLLALVGIYFLLPQTPKPIAGMNLFYAKYGHNHLASYLLVVLPLVLVKWIKRSQSVLWRNLSLFFLVNLLLTFSRGALVILPIISVVILLFYRPKRFQTALLGATSVLPFLLLLGIMLISHSDWAQGKQDRVEPTWIERQLIKPVNAEGRLNYWQQAWRGWQQRPFLGNGPGTFRLTSLRFQKEPHTTSSFAHSSVLEHLTETGILGAVAFLLLTLMPLIFLWKREIKDRTHGGKGLEYHFPLLLGTTALWLHSLIDFDFNFTAIFLLFWVNIAALMATDKQRGKQKPLSRLALSGITALSIVLFLFVSLSIVGKMLLLRAETQKNQNPTRAKNLYEKALVIFPFDQGQWMIALTSLNDQRFPLPEALKRQAVFYNRRTPQVLSLLARNERQLNQPQEARRLYQLLTDLDPQNPDYPWQLFELALKADYFKETWAFWVRILSLACWEETAKYDQLASATCSVPLTLPPNQSQLQEAFLSYLKTLDPNRLSGPNKAFLAKAAYQLGLTALDYQQVDLALALWQTAVWLAPQWSYFHLELARLWLLTGEENKASEALQLCLQFAYAQEHCQSFLDRDMKPLRDAPVGFLQETIDASF